MSWSLVSSKIPTSIGSVVVNLVSQNGSSNMSVTVAVLDEEGNLIEQIIETLSTVVIAGRIQQAIGILGDVRTKAEADLLP